MERVLITGGLGFIGKSIVNSLMNSGYTITLLDSLEPSRHGNNRNFTIFEEWLGKVNVVIGSVTNKTLFFNLLNNTDIVIHLASQVSVPASEKYSEYYCNHNVIGTANLRDYIKDHNNVKKVIFTSSRAVYGEGLYRCPNNCAVDYNEIKRRGNDVVDIDNWDYKCSNCKSILISCPTPETFQGQPVSIYGLTKYMQEQLLLNCVSYTNTKIIILRLQNVYGPDFIQGNCDVGILNILCEYILKKKSVEFYEDGRQTRDFILMDDIINLILKEIKYGVINDEYSVMNIGSGTSISLIDLALVIAEIAGCKLKYVINNKYRIGDVRHMSADITRISRVLKWSPVALMRGIENIISSIVITNKT